MPGAAIDIHTHIVPGDIPAYAGRHDPARWPQMAAASDCHHKQVMIAGKNFRTVSDECWDAARRIEAMDRMGIGCQVLSPMPELLSYWFPAADGLAFARHVNDTIGAMVARGASRFAGLGMVPLQDPDLATRELENLMRDGFRGVEIGSNVNGAIIGDPKFEPFFAAAEKLGAAIFVHALHPSGIDRIVGPPRLPALLAFPCETSFAISSLITGGTLQKHPDLRLCFSHGGGVFALILPRLLAGLEMMAGLKQQVTAEPRAIARRLYYDTLVYDAKTLKFLIEIFGATQLCIGTDYPFEIHEKEPLRDIAALGLGAKEIGDLHAGNARRFLGLA
ncbi:MAG TPA: amidohydrolase family protein [Stellaceae bacterium]|nr:amidohydrolase family protein [Stellaceae bacterium]